MPEYLPAPPDYLAPYRAAKAQSQAEMNQRSAYAAQIAEMLGHYTPELQQQVLAPLGQYPTMGEYLFTAPVRGLGKLFGKKGMQQVGAPQEFQLTGPPEAPPTMPPLPAGVPEDMRNFLEQYAQSKGMMKSKGPSVTPNLPSEYSTSSPMLKTAQQRKDEADAQKMFWDTIAKTWKSEEDRNLANAQMGYYKAQSEHLGALNKQIEAEIKRGPTPTEWSNLKEYVDKNGLDYLDTVIKYRQAMKGEGAETAMLQMYNVYKQQGGTANILDFTAAVKRLNYDPARIVYEAFYSSDTDPYVYEDPAERQKVLDQRTLELTKMMEITNKGLWGPSGATVQEGGEQEQLPGQPAPQPKAAPGKAKAAPSAAKAPPPKTAAGAPVSGKRKKLTQEALNTFDPNTPLPPELAAMKVTPANVKDLMRQEGITQSQAIEMFMDFYRMKKGGQ